VARALPPPGRAGGGEVLLVFDHDRYALLAALLGTWAAGHAALLVETARRIDVGPRVDRAGLVEILHDTGAGRGIFVEALLGGGGSSDGGAGAPPPREGIPFGPTVGGARLWSRDEVRRRVEAACADGAYLRDELVASTLAPTSAFGVLHSLLAPLVAGAVVWLEAPRALDAFAASMRRSRPGVLVTSEAG